MNDSTAMRSGLVTASFGNRGEVEVDGGESSRFIVQGRKLRVVCGDRVTLQTQPNGAELLVTAIKDRHNLLERSDTRGKAEILAANLTRIAVIVAPEPPPDFYLADRYLCAAELLAAEALLVWNKTDLGQARPAELQEYAALGYTVLDTAAETNAGTGALAQALQNGISILVGQSGVGKSSLINQLLPDAGVVVGELSTASGEGRHTTTATVMHRLPAGGYLIDSPGVREFLPAIQDPRRIATGFRELAALAPECRFADCMHLREPDCAVKHAADDARISPRRYESYKRLLHNTEASRLKQPYQER